MPGQSSLSQTSAGPNRPIWDDGLWEPLPALAGDATCDTCVIGLGGSGLTAIQELLAQGVDVVGVDGNDVAAGAAGRNGGFLLAGAYDFYHDAVRLHGRAQALAIYQATLEEIANIASVAPETVRFTGSCRIAASDAEVEDCRTHERAMQTDGLNVEWYDDAHGVGLFMPRDATFNPLARCRTMALTLMRSGARLFARSAVTALSATRVVTANGVIHCRRVIVAVDGCLEQVLPELAYEVRTARLQMLATAPTTEIEIPCAMYYREGFEYWQQNADGSVALGGFRDRAGEGEWTTQREPAEPVQGMLETFLREHLKIRAEITHRWAGLVGYTKTGLPIIREVRDGVWAIGGYSGTGNVIGALAARAVVHLMLHGDRKRASVLLPQR